MLWAGAKPAFSLVRSTLNFLVDWFESRIKEVRVSPRWPVCQARTIVDEWLTHNIVEMRNYKRPEQFPLDSTKLSFKPLLQEITAFLSVIFRWIELILKQVPRSWHSHYVHVKIGMIIASHICVRYIVYVQSTHPELLYLKGSPGSIQTTHPWIIQVQSSSKPTTCWLTFCTTLHGFSVCTYWIAPDRVYRVRKGRQIMDVVFNQKIVTNTLFM